MKKKIVLGLFVLLLAGVSSAQACEVVEAENASSQDVKLEAGASVNYSTNVSTGPEGMASFVCGSNMVHVDSGLEGPLNQVGEVENPDVEVEQNVSIKDALKNTEEIEENLDEVNQALDQQLPDTLKSLVFGDNVNFAVDNTTIGIETNQSGITDVEKGGLEDPTLEISMEEERIEQILESNNSVKEVREAYSGDGIEVEAHSLKNKAVFGAVNLANKAYGLLSGVF
ncbi:MAG: hypothetical protein ACLFTA_02630 [Candidatus Nanohaloarchaea archaeon]